MTQPSERDIRSGKPRILILNKEASPKDSEYEYLDIPCFYDMLNYARVLRGDSQLDAARRIGVNPSRYDSLERGTSGDLLSIDVVRELAYYTNMLPSRMRDLVLGVQEEVERLKKLHKVSIYYADVNPTLNFKGRFILQRAFALSRANYDSSLPLPNNDLPQTLFFLRYKHDLMPPVEKLEAVKTIVTLPFRRFLDASNLTART